MRPRLRLNGIVTFVMLCAANLGAGPVPRQHALLVGCTRYDRLERRYALEGPANDVLLMRDVLKLLYGFRDEDVTILSEEAGKSRGPSYRPTRANIEREFANLAKKARTGDQVVILLGGHGSQQPDSRPDDPDRFEPDGKEEIFLPADCGGWDGISRVKNAIVDYELRDWLKAIRKTGASLWVIVDACHSGSMIRGQETPREVPAEKLVPREVLQKAVDKARQRQLGTGARPVKKALNIPPNELDLVVIYAAQSIEPTVELLLPEEGEDRKPQGLLTYTLCKVLVEARQANSPLTYHELLLRIQDRYRALNRTSPTPLIEGKDRNRVVLGTEVRSSGRRGPLIRLNGDEQNRWFIDAGALHGMTIGSILRVYPPAGTAQADKPVGHVQILPEEFSTLRALVKPCAHNGTPSPATLPQDGRCEVVMADFGGQRLGVAVDETAQDGATVPPERAVSLREVVQQLDKEENSLVEVAASPAAAQWLLRFESAKSDKVYLVPSSGWVLPAQSGPAGSAALRQLPPLFGPVPAGREQARWLRDRLGRIARVRNLQGIAMRAQSAQRSRALVLDTKVRMELARFENEADVEGRAIQRGPAGVTLYDGDSIVARLMNEGRNPVDVTLLLVDGQYGIQSVFPPRPSVDNRIGPGESLPLQLTVSGKTSGLEHLLLIGVNAKDVQENAYFGFLAQPSIESAKREILWTGAGARERGFDSPFGKLLQHAVFGSGKMRAIEVAKAKDYAFQIVSYGLVPTRRPAKRK